MKKANQREESEQFRIKHAAEILKNQAKALKQYQKSKVYADQGMEFTDAAVFKETYDIMVAQGRGYYGSVDILEDQILSSNAKVLFQILSSLSYKEGYCYGSNQFLADKMGVSESSIKIYLNELQHRGLIAKDTYNTPLGWRRHIHIQFQFIKDLYLKKK